MKSRVPPLAIVLACLAIVASAEVAAAHADLVESDPAEGGTIETPYTLTATFDEPLEPSSSVIVRNAAGDEVARGGVSDAAATVLLAELTELPAGEYRARWTATTADGHSERGTINFVVVAASPAPTDPATPTAEPAPTSTAAATSSPVPATPTPTPTPTATPVPIDGGPSAGTADLLIALVLAGLAIAAVAGYIFLRGRR